MPKTWTTARRACPATCSALMDGIRKSFLREVLALAQRWQGTVQWSISATWPTASVVSWLRVARQRIAVCAVITFAESAHFTLQYRFSFREGRGHIGQQGSRAHRPTGVAGTSANRGRGHISQQGCLAWETVAIFSNGLFCPDARTWSLLTRATFSRLYWSFSRVSRRQLSYSLWGLALCILHEQTRNNHSPWKTEVTCSAITLLGGARRTIFWALLPDNFPEQCQQRM